jgi:hypothetical protein
LVVTGAGVVLTATMMLLTRSDRRFVEDHGVVSGRLYEGIVLAFWQEARRFVVKIFLFSIGIEALVIPRRPDPPPQDSSAWVFTGALFGVVILLNYSTIAAMRYRHKYMSGDALNGHDERG